jgi:hypothetical protein
VNVLGYAKDFCGACGWNMQLLAVMTIIWVFGSSRTESRRMILTRKIFFYNMIFKDQIFAMLAWHHWVRSLQRQQFSTQDKDVVVLIPISRLHVVQYPKRRLGNHHSIWIRRILLYGCTVLPIALPWWPTMPISGDAVTIVLCPLFSLK